MTPDKALLVPARTTTQELAKVVGRDLADVQAVLRERGEPDGPDDVLSAELAAAVGEALGVKVAVEARDLALELLYQLETGGMPTEEPAGKAGRIVEGVTSGLDDLDARIESVSEHWSVARMPVIDRNILRIGLYELVNEKETPVAVIVSEAVRLAQAYSTERSGAFVNGVLATLAKSVRGTQR